MPHPDPVTVGPAVDPDRAEARAWRTVRGLLEGLEHGRLEVRTPEGYRHRFGSGLGTHADLQVHDWGALRRILAGGGVGLGEGYLAGEWSSDDLVGLLRLLIADRPNLRRRITARAVTAAVADRLLHATRTNRVGRVERNVQAHYDLSNAFYERFLDPTMTYSCAYFPSPQVDLEQAQLAKYRRIAELARLQPGQRVLEVGCGWGGFAAVAAHEFGCHVTGLTLSEEQARYARARAHREGFADRFDVRLLDYRAIEGRFDRVVSIEMLEAVGHRYLGEWFATVDRVLAPDGLAVAQVITLPDQRYGRYRWRPDFIAKHVFPGGHLPSLGALTAAARDHSQLLVDHVENLAPHYAETLRRWRARFLANRHEVSALGFDDRFLRLWDFYLAYCEAAFAERYVNLLQLVFTRVRNPTLGNGPYAVGTPERAGVLA